MFTSLSIILLAFFILLNSMATMEEKRVKAALGSLTAVFSGFGTGPLFPRADSLVTIGEELAMRAGGPGRELKKKVDDMLAEEGLGEKVELVEDKDDLLLVFKDHILFDSSQAYIKPQMTDVLEVISGFVSTTDFPLVVEGHTDNNPISTARFPSNWELSTARAGAVVRRLVEVHGVDAHKISGVGCGEFKPIAANDTPENRAKNRRVVLRFAGMAKAEREKIDANKDIAGPAKVGL